MPAKRKQGKDMMPRTSAVIALPLVAVSAAYCRYREASHC